MAIRPTPYFYAIYKENAFIGVAQRWAGPKGGQTKIKWAAPPRREIRASELLEYDVMPVELHALHDETFCGSALLSVCKRG